MSHATQGHFQDDSLGSLLERQVATRRDATFVLAARGGRVVTYRDLGNAEHAWRRAMSEWSLSSGQRVGVIIADPLDFAEYFVAMLATGVWVAPLDPTITYVSADQLEHRIASLGLDAILADRPGPLGTAVPWHETLSIRDFTNAEESRVDPADGGVILASSGTTGTPKVVALPMAQLLHVAGLIADHNQLGPGERGFNPLPLWHINAEVVGLLSTMVSGASLALDERFHRTDFWDVVDRVGATWINAVPAIISRLSTLREGESAPARVRFIRSASAPLPPALLEEFELHTGIPVIESYGMTEAASQICVNPLDGVRKVGSVGRPVGVDLRVMSMEEGASGEVATSEVGHVEIKGPSVILRYEATGYEDRFDTHGWLRTGDLGFVDADGFVFLVGRSDDVINRGGEKIMPREIEEVAMAVAGVVGAAVIGQSDDVFGQVPVLYVELEAVSAETPVERLQEWVDQIHSSLRENFARSRRPVTINVVEKLPAHATGKIQKKALATDPVTVLLRHELA